jgi:twitching motility protein PilT
MLDTILQTAQQAQASDIHICGETASLVRVLGSLRKLDETILSVDDVMTIIKTIVTPQQLAKYKEGDDIDTSYSDSRNQRYRINIYRTQERPSLAIRLLRNHIPTLDELNLPSVLKLLADEPRGLVLVTGPTGSGKSTTLAAMIDYINSRKPKHILTLEDPIEYIHHSKNSHISQREIHRDVKGFNEALRSALREDPDVILVGEMRDYETISLALTAAETGHLVFSTLHTTGAASTIDRIIDVFPPHQQSQIRSQLASVLKGVVSQTLIPRIDVPQRIAVHEIMIMNDAIGNLIRENKLVQINSVIQMGLKLGMQSLETGLARLVSEGVISQESALEFSSNKEYLKRLL